MLKVGVLMNKFLPEKRPSGIGVVGYHLSEAISKRNTDVSLFCKGSSRMRYEVNPRFHVETFPHYTVSLLFQMLKHCALANFDVLHVHTTSTLPEIVMAKVQNISILRQFHGRPKGIERKIDCELSDRLAVVSEFSRGEMPLKFIKKTKVIYNGVDVETFKPVEPYDVASRYDLPKHSKMILSIGMIQERKGQHLILEIMKQLAKEYPKILYVNVGRPYSLEYFHQLQSLVESSGVPENVRFLTGVPVQDLVQLINSSDICVHPALSEAFALAVLEELSCGKPVVAFDNSSIPEQIEHMKTGLLTKTGDLRGLHDSIMILLKDEALARDLGKRARERILERFTWDRSAETAVSVYNETLASRD